MSTVAGRVLDSASAAVSGVLVTAFSVASGDGPQARRRRLGTVATGQDGSFLLDHHEGETNGSGRADRWDLAVTVEAVSEGRGESAARELLATETREDASPRETFRFIVPAKRLKAAGIPSPKPVPEDPATRARETRQAQEALRQIRAKEFATSVRQAQKRRETAAKAFDGFRAALSSVPRQQRSSVRGYVSTDANPLEESLRVMRGTVKKPLVAGAAATAVLDDSKAKALMKEYGDAVPAAAVSGVAWPWKTGRTTILTRRGALRGLCGGPPPDDCVAILEGEPVPDEDPETADTPSADADPPADENGAGPVDPPTVAALVHMQEDSATSPETPVSPQTRALLQDVQDGVDGFVLRSGPADTPALFDFHHLRIAFEPVWQELFDTKLIAYGEALYGNLVDAGVDPNKYLFGDSSPKPFLNLSPTGPAQSETHDPINASVVQAFEITEAEWDALAELQGALIVLARQVTGEEPTLAEKKYNEEHDGDFVLFPFGESRPDFAAARAEPRHQGEHMIEFARSRLANTDTFDQFHSLLKQLDDSLKEPYRFNVYAANRWTRSINFGLVVTYRQRWEPVSYQVGELVKTIPLAPKETRRFTKRTVTKQSRAEREVNTSLQSRRTESTDTWRVEAEIVQKAMSKTNFQLGASGGVSIGIASASASTALSHNVATQSSEVKNEFREAVFKAADEFKEERSLQVDTSDSIEATAEDAGELVNPNDEIPVTYLFYQLQRRYRVSEEIRSVTPVVLVAQEFPNPSDIDEDWIVAHDWILRRVILDDSFVPALNYLSTKVVGDEVALRELYKNVEQHRKLVKELKNDFVSIERQVRSRYSALEIAIARHASAVQEDEEGGGIIPMPVGALLDDSDASPEAMRLREDAARDAYERAAKEEKELQARLDRETTALATVTDTYAKSLSEHLNRRAQISRLRVHIKANIFYYMQAIWSHEPPDQRYFRLRDARVPRFEGKLTYKLEDDPDATPLPPNWKKPKKLTAHVTFDPGALEWDPLQGFHPAHSEALGDVADLDNLLGFKGNYMLFSLQEGNDLTEFLMAPYLDGFSQLVDPDPLGNWTLHDFVEYTCCLRRELSKDKFLEKLPGLIEAYKMLKERGAEDEEIVVPTDSLYIEALPGVRPVLEDFKLLHRAIDVKRAQADVRAVELENVRLAARLLAGEREDPTIEKKVVIEGVDSIDVGPDV